MSVLRGSILVTFLTLVGCGEAENVKGPPSASGPPEVGVVTLHPQSVAVTAELPGRTGASLVAEVRPQVGGLIKERLFQEGGEIKAGDVLYQIDPASYQASYESAVASLQKNEAALPSAQAKVDRYERLIKQNVVSQQDLDDALASLAQAKADVASAKASVESAKINLDYTKITAPISGRIGKSSLTQGALVTASQETALTTIRTLDPINVDVTESSTRLLDFRRAVDEGRLKLSGTNISVKLKLDNGVIYPHVGKMEFLEANVDQGTGTVGLRAQFPNPNRLLLPGMYVRAIIEAAVSAESFLVPQRAVSHNAKGEATALVVNAEGKVEERLLVISGNLGNDWVVDSGINDGDRIIVEGTQLARTGQSAAPIEVVIDEVTGEIKERKASSIPASKFSGVANNSEGPPLSVPANN